MTNDRLINTSDATYIFNYAYSGGPPPTAPFPGCGVDPPSQVPSFPDFLTCFQSPCP
jgi:hypothetical protein